MHKSIHSFGEMGLFREFNREIFPTKVTVKNERIDGSCDNYIIPGFIDAHIHIESSMLPPSEFLRLAACHGTVATVSDPHEIANVLGSPVSNIC